MLMTTDYVVSDPGDTTVPSDNHGLVDEGMCVTLFIPTTTGWSRWAASCHFSTVWIDPTGSKL